MDRQRIFDQNASSGIGLPQPQRAIQGRGRGFRPSGTNLNNRGAAPSDSGYVGSPVVSNDLSVAEQPHHDESAPSGATNDVGNEGSNEESEGEVSFVSRATYKPPIDKAHDDVVPKEFSVQKGPLHSEQEKLEVVVRNLLEGKLVSKPTTIDDLSTLSTLMPPIADDEHGYNHQDYMLELFIEHLEERGLLQPSPIQRYAIPLIMTRKNVVCLAPNGSGKTLSYIIPAVCYIIAQQARYVDEGKARAINVDGHVACAHPAVLVVAPTREAVMQIAQVVHGAVSQLRSRVRHAAFYGGTDLDHMRLWLDKNPNLVIATPGRLRDMVCRRQIELSHCEMVVLDEAHLLLAEPNFSSDLTFIAHVGRLSLLAQNVQFVLATATISFNAVQAMFDAVMCNDDDAYLVHVANSQQAISQEFHLVRSDADRLSQLQDVLINMFSKEIRQFGTEPDSESELTVRDLTTEERVEVLNNFHNGTTPVLISTNVLSTSVDVPNIQLVVNYDVPDAGHLYIQRAGRSGRLGNTGRVVTFVDGNRRNDIHEAPMLVHLAKEAANPPAGRTPQSRPPPQWLIDIADLAQRLQPSHYIAEHVAQMNAVHPFESYVYHGKHWLTPSAELLAATDRGKAKQKKLEDSWVDESSTSFSSSST